MPLPVTSQYAPPQSWEEFESLCCDLFGRIWNDSGTQKHGRQGQPQGGVDVYGRPDGKHYSGVQCKKKEVWPPAELTTTEVDEEVAKAKTWDPGLKHYIIATTAPNDEKLQAHARAITKAHSKQKLFSVEVVSWTEITRRLAQHPDLLRTYGYLPEINIAETVRLVSEHLRQNPQRPDEPPTSKTLAESVKQDPAVVEAVERDLASRFSRSMRRSFFPETIQVDEYVSVAENASEPEYAHVSPELRRRIFLRAARSAAVRGSVEKAEELLRQAQSLEGPDSDVLARARILERRSDIDGALALIRDETDTDSRSTVFNMLVRHRGAAAGLKWLEDDKLTVGALTVNGLQTMASAYLQTSDFDGLRARLDDITPQQLSEGPYFRFLRAMVNVASILPLADREVAVHAFQVDVRRGTRSILDATTTAARLDRAIDDLTALLPVAAELGLNQAKRLAEAYTRWCELLHPYRKDVGLATLRSELKDPKTARERLSLAFAFDPKFEPGSLQDYLKRREQLGGLDDDDLAAALIIQIHNDDPESVAALIARYRARLEEQYRGPPIFTVELQALALAGDTSSARVLLDKHRDELTPNGAAAFEALIAKGEGKDPVAEDLKLYESTKTLEALRTLVMSLAARKDHRAVAKYSEELFALTSDPHDIARAAQAFALLGDGAEFIRVVDAHPSVKDQSPGLLRNYAWELFKKGRLRESKEYADRLARDFPADRDLQLEIAIAIETGEWESLSKPLSAFLDDVSKYSGLDLIRAAHIAQQSGQGPMMDLVKAAVAKAEDNAHVWLGAYTIIVEEGLEDDHPESHDWLRRALALSDKKGPVQQFELKELVPQQLEWNKRTRDISDRITKAEVPLVIAAPRLRTTVVDILLRNLVRNAQLDDARRKYVIPLFSGHRLPWQGGLNFENLGLDVSALLVLGWLGKLQKVFQAYKVVTLPATVLTELFEGRRRVQQVQKSRIKRARELEQALLRNRVTIARPIEKDSDPLSAEVGASLAALIRSAAESGGSVLRPGPVHRPGLEQIPADVTSALPHLCDMHTLLKQLADGGLVTQTDEETARNYFELQDKGLAGCAVPDTTKPLFIDSLALVYLQYTNLLGAVLKAFKDVRIEGNSEDEALAIIEHDQHVGEVLNVIDEIRNSIRAANASEKILFGPRRAEGRKSPDDDTPSTLHLLSDLSAVDALVCDDRALNKENFAGDGNGKRIPCLTTLDILEELRTRGSLSEMEWIAARHKLRSGGAALMPVQTSEVVHAARRSRSAVSAEMRAIQQSIDLTRVAEIPTFPREVQWFASISMTIKAAVLEMWKSETDPAVAGRLSNLIMSLMPKPNDWASRWEAGPPPQWVDAVDRVILASLAMPVELTDDKIVDAFNIWYEQNHLEPLRSVWPDRYRAVVEQVRSFMLSSEDDDDEKKKNKPRKPSRSASRRQRASKSAVGKTAAARKLAASKIDLPRFRVLFSLRKLSIPLQSDVMSDGSVSEKYNIPTHRAGHLGPKISLDQGRLLAAFRTVLAGKKAAPLIDDNGKIIRAEISFDRAGTAQLKMSGAVFSFSNAGLLSPNPEARVQYLEAALKERTLASIHADTLRSKVERAELSDDEFLSVVEVLLTAPESFIQTVKAKIATRDLTNSDLLPDKLPHWDNLIAPLAGSQNLSEFLVNERQAESSRMMDAGAARAFLVMSLSFCAPALVPIETFKSVPTDEVLQTLERAASLPDHFAVAGAFEICADWVGRDDRIEAAGIKLLDQQFGNMDQLKDRCAFYAAIFAMTLARLAQHETLRRKPAFWRRITAAAHASLALRSCGTDNAENVFKWAMEHSGKAFLFSVLLEGDREPRWKPEWLTAKHLIADVFGRIDAAVTKLSEEARPSAWIDRIAKAREWIVANSAELFCILPAIGESARRPMVTEVETLAWFQPFFRNLSDKPSGDTLLLCGPGFYTVGVTKDALLACHKLIAELRKDAPRWNDGDTQYILQTLSFAALQAQDVPLVDSVADFCVEKVRDLSDGSSTLDILCRLTECASANPNRDQAMHTIARRLEDVAFLALPSTLIDLHDSLRHLQLLDEALARNLGRAVATSRLGKAA
jgi:hypothetical protein